ncbi:MAG TPA: acetyl-CoA carboxylase biotin carboxyl carrier protein subunit [Pyrinomonadaceae bacterium]|nr:acetyl-CoA carboxylase biotin carboxyl carrier protein subunit [Pyrinomonadaceae bacterium]
MKLKAQIADTEHQISLNTVENSVTAEIEGRGYDLMARENAGGVLLITNGTTVYRCRIETRREAGKYDVTLRGRSYEITIIDPKRLRSSENAAGHGHGTAEIVSPMPGKVVRLLVAAGDSVEAGAGIIVVEAMKMQNEMKAPKAGVVISISVASGATVNAGDVLAVIE